MSYTNKDMNGEKVEKLTLYAEELPESINYTGVAATVACAFCAACAGSSFSTGSSYSTAG
ncbi:thiocillin family RiPP [Virgibacillus dokdonensis]|uniref:thiocillin family RiPP n=1 Tax=Virgibacillus dokdonensis TaxID=302167 RepID=UPI00098A384E|nr:thiocillin family RiPP [Virgibacillus dokdonensis]